MRERLSILPERLVEKRLELRATDARRPDRRARRLRPHRVNPAETTSVDDADESLGPAIDSEDDVRGLDAARNRAGEASHSSQTFPSTSSLETSRS